MNLPPAPFIGAGGHEVNADGRAGGVAPQGVGGSAPPEPAQEQAWIEPVLSQPIGTLIADLGFLHGNRCVQHSTRISEPLVSEMTRRLETCERPGDEADAFHDIGRRRPGRVYRQTDAVGLSCESPVTATTHL